ncbi:MAG TPA: hypothetical protein VGQ67_06090 [Candidatus Polarisedimenticolia bacterium]|jgi:hypothetical protein|nr:hypothetical protein [Candidatus Polarisedimenticolia bacterium]
MIRLQRSTSSPFAVLVGIGDLLLLDVFLLLQVAGREHLALHELGAVLVRLEGFRHEGAVPGAAPLRLDLVAEGDVLGLPDVPGVDPGPRVDLDPLAVHDEVRAFLEVEVTVELAPGGRVRGGAGAEDEKRREGEGGAGGAPVRAHESNLLTPVVVSMIDPGRKRDLPRGAVRGSGFSCR